MRLFIGLPLSDAAANDTASIAARIESSVPGRYVLKGNYHMTLAFLGEVPQARLEEARHALRAFAARFPAPKLTLGDLSYFKQPSNAILIRRVESIGDLAAMHAALVAELDAFALPHTDGPFSPHVTLARRADLTGISPEKLSCAPVAFDASHAILYLSARDEQDVLRYTPLCSAPFDK